ncbi:uncharacterized protein LOC103394373 isoform X4 [Cynoglossus semilaevis]|uniref:uncharacterized protein LOC103394373 isoform X4 n=1 Tax=Cynoglossus semilaevis TaxID=244447 RepID=UPI0007DC842B|nr:uncharacterized protein LOC103394373 isoform X4 [Cynoglossus semilaevis]
MASVTLNCQLCCKTFSTVHGFNDHLWSVAHCQQYMSVFWEVKTPRTYGFYPNIVFADPRHYDYRKPKVGISLLTLCYGEQSTTFYLCHVCEVTCRPHSIMQHLSKGDHCFNYFNYTDPNILTFSWTPCMDMKVILKPQVKRELKEKGPGVLQILTLPVQLLQRIKNCSYSEVMNIIGENQMLLKLFEAAKPQRNTFQMYQKDRNRKHPLLGMQHIIEFICAGQPEKRRCLCTLCKLTVGNNMILKHVLSFDHIYSYFKATHPSIVLSKYSYLYSESITSMMLDLVKQAGEMNSVADTKQVTLDPVEFASLNSTGFGKALKTLESYPVDKSGSGLITNLEPSVSPCGTESSTSTNLGDDAPEEMCQKMEPTSERSDYTGKDIMQGTKKEMERIKRENKEPILEISEKTWMDVMKWRTEKIKEETEELKEEIEETKEEKVDITGKMQEVEHELEERKMNITEDMELDTQERIIKEEEDEEVVTKVEHISKIRESCLTTFKGIERFKESTVQVRSPVTIRNRIKMSNSTSDKPQETPHSEATGGRHAPKIKCFSSNKELFHEESQKIQSAPSGKSHEAAEIKAETEDNQKTDLLWGYIKKRNREPVIGLHALLECNFDEHSPIYLCYCCCRRIFECNIVSHVTGIVHWRKYLAWSEKVPVQRLKQKKTITRQLVAYFEHCEGHGEAQIIDVDEKNYLAVLSQPFTLASQALKSRFPIAAAMSNKQPTSSATVQSEPEEHLQSSATSVGVVHTSSSTAQSAISTMNIRLKKKQMEVGKSELIVVRCGRRQQVYCKLCRDRLRGSEHLSSHSHLSNYVKQKFGHNASTITLEKIIPFLVAIENILGAQKGQIVEVTSDLYDALAALYTHDALKEVEMMLQHQMNLQVPSVSTTNNAEKLQAVVISSCETPCPDVGMLVQLNQKPAPEGKCRPKQKENDVKQSTVTPVTAKWNRFEAQALVELNPPHSAVPVVNSQRADTVAAHTESPSSTVVQTPLTYQDTQVSIKLEDTYLVTSVKEEPPSDDLVKIEQENHPGTNLTDENSFWLGLVPEQHYVSQELPSRSSGDESQMHSSENTVELETDVIIGRHFVWKCQGPSGNSFYLCESCKETIFTCHIAHMSNPVHWLAYIKWQHPSFLHFWDKDEYPVEVKQRALRKAAIGFSRRENFYNPTLQHVTLGPLLYDYVKAAPFFEALKIVQSKMSEQRLTSSESQRRVKSNTPEGPQNHTSLADSQQRPVSGLEVRLAETHSKSKSVQSPEGCQSSLSQESHWKESSRSRKRLSQAAAKTLICENNLHEDSQGLWPAKRSQSFAPQHSGTRPSTASWSNSCLLSAVPAPCLTKKKTKDL